MEDKNIMKKLIEKILKVGYNFANSDIIYYKFY